MPNVPAIRATRPVTFLGDPGHAGNERHGRRDDESSEAVVGAVMRASVGDVLVVTGRESRAGLVIGVVGMNGAPPYVIKWLNNGHIAMVTPHPYSRIVRASTRPHPERRPPNER